MTRRAAPPAPPEEVSIYRNHCIALLRRYFVMSIEVGRLPAILGRELFTTRAEDFHTHSFEDTVLFVIDVERVLERLHPFDQQLIALIVLQEYTEEEATKLLHCGLRTVERRLPDALDALTRMFLNRSMINTAERVPDQGIAGADQQAKCRKRVPQRARRIMAQAAPVRSGGAGNSRFEKALVKPPKSPDFPHHSEDKPNIFLPDVAGLPPSICYAEYIS
jgi:hypothetical protein